MNDFAKCGNASCTNTQIALMNSNITTLIKNLAAKGAKHFYLGGAPEGVGKYRKGYNSQLATDASSLSKSLGIDVVFYDYAAFSNKNFIVPDSGISYSTTTPNSFGFDYFYPAACYTGNYTRTTGTIGTICSNPWAYIFWDTPGFHAATRFARMIANSMTEQIAISY